MLMPAAVMTLLEVAECLEANLERIREWADSGVLPAIKIGDQWQVRRSDFETWLVGHTTTSPTGQRFIVLKTLTTRPLDDLTERQAQPELHRRLIKALGPSVLMHTSVDIKPLDLDLLAPLPQKVRAYLYNLTRPPGGRPLGEHKVQLIVPGQRRGDRASFDNSGGRIVLLLGYAAEEDIFVLWDAGLYSDFAWSRNVQVKSETIIAATAGRLATQERQLRPSQGTSTTETVLAVKPRLLCEAINRRMQLTRERLLRD
jgi:excisionase family DNA binding protein